jgi:hypothetical protein
MRLTSEPDRSEGAGMAEPLDVITMGRIGVEFPLRMTAEPGLDLGHLSACKADHYQPAFECDAFS